MLKDEVLAQLRSVLAKACRQPQIKRNYITFLEKEIKRIEQHGLEPEDEGVQAPGDPQKL